MMAPTYLFAACFLAQTGTTPYQEPEPEINWPTHVDAEHYYNPRLPISRLQQSPVWKPEDDNPPLSARKAMTAAAAVMKELAPYGKDAELSSPTLKLRESNGYWFWVVYYSPNDWRRYQSTFPVVVLMDGEVVRPRLTPFPRSLE